MRTNVTVHQLAEGEAWLNVLSEQHLGMSGVGVSGGVLPAERYPNDGGAYLALYGHGNFRLIAFDGADAANCWLEGDAKDALVVYRIQPSGVVPVSALAPQP